MNQNRKNSTLIVVAQVATILLESAQPPSAGERITKLAGPYGEIPVSHHREQITDTRSNTDES